MICRIAPSDHTSLRSRSLATSDSALPQVDDRPDAQRREAGQIGAGALLTFSGPVTSEITEIVRALERDHVRQASGLTAAQVAALEAVRRRADACEAHEKAAVAPQARITLNFHPDRRLSDGRVVAEAMAEDGIYRSQFETGLSNGSRTAFPGGERDGWEHKLFDGAYRDSLPRDRPKYGALNLMAYTDGAAPRFGSCHVRLRPAALDRATFTFGDSHLGPDHVGTLDAFHCVHSALRGTAWSVTSPGRALDDYVEAQVHGPITFAAHAEAVVLDPSFLGTPIAEHLAAVGVPMEWHGGFELRAAEYDSEFRGPHMPPLAAAVAAEYGDVIDAAVVGRFASEPDRWSRFGEPDELLQYAKHLWHTLVWYGHPRGTA